MGEKFARVEMDEVDGRERFRVRAGGFMASWFPKTMEDVVKNDCDELNTYADKRAQEKVGEALEKAARIADDEPELEGKPSREVLEEMMKVGPVTNARAVCRATKKSIALKIRKLAEDAGRG